jgi:AcrR family transcriptional regulator
MAPSRPNLLAGQQFPPPPQQERSRRKREALLQAALALFAEQGYDDTTIEAIARRAGVAVGGFYQHFATKRQVLLVLMDQVLFQAETLAEQAGTADFANSHAVIEALVRHALQLDWAFAGAYRAWREAAVRDRELGVLQRQIEHWSARQLEGLFRALLATPGARQDVDVATLAWELTLLVLRLAEVPVEQPDAVEAVIASLTHLIYHALFTDER